MYTSVELLQEYAVDSITSRGNPFQFSLEKGLHRAE